VILVSGTGPSSFGNLPMVYRGVKYAIVKDIDVHPCWRWTFDVNDRHFVGRKSAAALPKSKRGEQSTRHWDRSAQSVTRHLSQCSLSNQRNAAKGAVKRIAQSRDSS
jgi:hypothetical protein